MTDLRTIKRLLIVAIILLILAIGAAATSATAQSIDGGGGGYCNPLYLRLGGCEPTVKCDIGTPQIQQDADGRYYLECYYAPTAPVNDGGPLVIDLGVGELAHVLCETRLHFDLFQGEQGLEVLCEE